MSLILKYLSQKLCMTCLKPLNCVKELQLLRVYEPKILQEDLVQ